MTDDKHITIIDDIIAPLTDDQHAALLELAKAHPDLGANVTSFSFQPLDLTAVRAVINDVGVKVYEAFQPFIDQIADVIDRIDAIYQREYGMTMSEFMALQEYFDGQLWDIDWEEE